MGYAYGYPYHHVPLTYTHAVTTTPVTYTVPHALTYAHHYPYTYGYGHLPYLIKPAEKAPERKKREADGEPKADADPAAWYGHYYGYGGYGHRYYGYGGYYGYPRYGWSHGYGK